MVEAMAVIGLCLIVAVLALAGVSIALAFIVYKRLGQREAEVGQDIAERIIGGWNTGSETHRKMVQDIQTETEIDVETRIRRQQYQRQPENLRDVMNDEDEPTVLGTFGQAPIIPEMRTSGIEG